MSTPYPPSLPARQLDLTALTEPLDQQAVRNFADQAKATGQPWAKMTTGLRRPGAGDVFEQALPVVIPAIGLGALLYLGGRGLISAVVRFTWAAPFPLNLVVVGVAALILVGFLLTIGQLVRLIRSLGIPNWWWEAAYRLTRFAAANGLRYGHDESANYPGVIFGTGTERTIERRLTTQAGRRIEIGNYRYTVTGDDNKDTRVYGWGYVAITLDRRLPHLLLDAKANDNSVFGIRTSNLPVDLAPDQRLRLGGEFDDKFTLYAPSEYGRDTFGIFTPDLMALFIDRLGTFDVEFIDDTMFVYGGRFDLTSPATYRWLQELVETAVARTIRRTDRYSDELAALEFAPQSRLAQSPAPVPDSTDGSVFAFSGDGPPQHASNSVAAQGRRLRTRRWGVWGVIGLLLVAVWLYDEVVAPIFGLPRLDN